MPARKRRPKEVKTTKKNEEIKPTKRGRLIKKTDYKEPDYVEDSESESSQDGKNLKGKQDSDDDFEVAKDQQSQSSSDGESLASEESDFQHSISESEGKQKRKSKKTTLNKAAKKADNDSKIYDKGTSVSNCGSTTSLLPSGVSIVPKGPKKNPLDMAGDMDEIDGQKIPSFMKSEFIRDKNLLKPDDPEYDPSSIDIPKDLYDRLTPGMKQYWDIKKDHFDSVVLWRKGDWYIVFYYDIPILNSASGSAPRTFHNEPGFYQNKVDFYTECLIKAGYKVVRVEQTETHEQAKDRTAAEKKKGNKGVTALVGREIVGKYTKGTFLKPLPIEDFLAGKEDDDQELDTKYVLLYLYDEAENEFGITYFDITTLHFFIGQFKDDSMKNKFRTLITRIRPVEVICETRILKSDSMQSMSKMLRSSPIPPVFSSINSSSKIDYRTSKELIEHYLGEDGSKSMPKLIHRVLNDFDNYHLCTSALGNSIKYLEHLMIAHQTIPLAEFQEYSHEKSVELGNSTKGMSMILDAQALENLEIFEVQGKQRRYTEGSLFHYLDRCTTKFGKRLFKKWVCSPIFNEQKLQDRLDSVEELVEKYTFVTKFKAKLRRFADLERYLCRVYKYSISTESNVIYVDVNSLSRLDELFILLTQLKDIIDVLDEVFGDREDVTSKRLKALLTFDSTEMGDNTRGRKGKKGGKKSRGKSKGKVEETKKQLNQMTLDSDSEDEKKEQDQEDDQHTSSNALLPDIRGHLDQFSKVITWKKIGKKNVPEPVPGLSKEFDSANSKVEKIKASIQACLKSARRDLEFPELKLNTNSKRYRFEFDVPNKRAKDLPKKYFPTSKSKLYQRFQTKELENLVEELEVAEDELKNAISPFLAKLFRKFYKRQHLWSAFVACIAELDCLMSLADVSKTEPDMTKPEIIHRESAKDKATLDIRDLRHPCVVKTVKNFIPNDVVIGGDEPLVNLITGPNMGGKSTLLRQSCIAVIMAQIGCYVPATSMKFTLCDRIFTRIGANDRILENKSTFFVEMEETKAIVEQSTPYSLVIMDELGRGTSTFDGYSIAHAVLTYQTVHNKCLTLFTTHYHMLIDSFIDNPEVQPMKMNFEVDEETGDIKFLYKFTKGYTLESQGIYIAKMALIPESILSKARIQSDLFKEKLKILEQKCKIRSKSKFESTDAEMQPQDA